jgi:hypothetical protein
MDENRENAMPRRKEAERFAVVGEKDCWHLYGLQDLSPNKFASVVQKVLQGRYWLINPTVADKSDLRLM